ncbi:MAG: hypothetical protein RL042_1757 [Nitrospirota bacterium]|jgi:c-di-GMP-binding flagellar brake protein YcgR
MEQRKFPRFSTQFPITFSGDGLEGEGSVCNLSTGGCAVESPASVQKGNYLRVRVYLPDQAFPLKVELAAVRWTTARQFGLEFITMPSEDQERLRRYVMTLQDPNP